MKKIILYTSSILLSLVLGSTNADAQNRNTHYFQDGTASTAYAPDPNAELLAFPNPATNNVTVQLPYAAQNAIDVLVLNFNGTVIRNYRFAPGGQSFSIDVSYLDQGNYVLHVHDGGRAAGYVKLIKGSRSM